MIATTFEARPRKGRAFFDRAVRLLRCSPSRAVSRGAVAVGAALAWASPLAAFEGPVATSAAPPSITCAAGEVASVVTELFLGRDAGGRRVVTEARWADFLAREVTPRFPDGLTVYDARGQWRDATGRITREATKVLMILALAVETPAGTASNGQSRADKIAAIVDAYKRRFHQKSVLVLTRAACARF
ncbi:DUF3574 domain-containing protein [Rhodoplanes azumiensis]|uniref:DUF3574 domain-containing protein n=1 Tax=Rhodoplanes azumiensis TaxID=1897628 RepID=A0ABW5APB0_9BRAD